MTNPDIYDTTRRALNGVDTEDSRHHAVLAIFEDASLVSRLDDHYQLLVALSENPALAESLHRARYYDDAPLVQRTEALKIGQMVLELFNAAADKFITERVEHLGLPGDRGGAA